jgi:hypothetical protein
MSGEKAGTVRRTLGCVERRVAGAQTDVAPAAAPVVK